MAKSELALYNPKYHQFLASLNSMIGCEIAGFAILIKLNCAGCRSAQRYKIRRFYHPHTDWKMSDRNSEAERGQQPQTATHASSATVMGKSDQRLTNDFLHVTAS